MMYFVDLCRCDTRSCPLSGMLVRPDYTLVLSPREGQTGHVSPPTFCVGTRPYPLVDTASFI